MKICMISNLYNPYIIGGAEINTERLVKALSRENNVFVITTKPFNNIFSFFSREEIRVGTRIYRFYPFNLYTVFSGRKRKIPAFVKAIWHIIDLFNLHTFLVVFNILKKEKPDVVHTSNLDGLSFSIFWVTKILNMSLVHTLNDYQLLCPYANLGCPYTKFNICKDRPFPCRIYSLFKKNIVGSIPSVVIGPSKFVVDIHKRYGFFRKSNFKIVPYLININKDFVPQKSDKSTLDILYVGRLSKEKGIDILIKAFKNIKEDFLRLTIIGDGKERQDLENLASGDLRIKFAGRVEVSGIKEFYKTAEAIVVPSVWYEPFGIIIIEAFSFGVFVIGSRIGGIQELVEDGYNGLLVSPGDKGDLESKLRMVINSFTTDNTMINRLKENAFKDSHKYARDQIIKIIEDVYHSTY